MCSLSMRVNQKQDHISFVPMEKKYFYTRLTNRLRGEKKSVEETINIVKKKLTETNHIKVPKTGNIAITINKK